MYVLGHLFIDITTAFRYPSGVSSQLTRAFLSIVGDCIIYVPMIYSRKLIIMYLWGFRIGSNRRLSKLGDVGSWLLTNASSYLLIECRQFSR